jgi:hypothetical protein
MRWIYAAALEAIVACASPAASFEGLRDIHVIKVASDEPGAFCADFLLSKRQATVALEQAARITQEQYLQQFAFLPCYVQGTAQLGGDPVEWEIRAGGNATITTADGEVIYLGCAECERTFGAR